MQVKIFIENMKIMNGTLSGIRINNSDDGPSSKGFIALLYHSAIEREPDICSKFKINP
jgi:hypothetical protein